jgi:hypothetical protein
MPSFPGPQDFRVDWRPSFAAWVCSTMSQARVSDIRTLQRPGTATAMSALDINEAAILKVCAHPSMLVWRV